MQWKAAGFKRMASFMLIEEAVHPPSLPTCTITPSKLSNVLGTGELFMMDTEQPFASPRLVDLCGHSALEGRGHVWPKLNSGSISNPSEL